MEVTALLFRLLMLELTLLGTQVQDGYTQRSNAAVISITPNRLQHFQYESVSFTCEGFDGSPQLRRITGIRGSDPECDTKKTISTGSVCTIDRVYSTDSGEYWCEGEGGERSNSLNITVTAVSVILESPVLPVLEGDDATLRCRSKTNQSNLRADFYKDNVLLKSSPEGDMTLNSVSISDEGLYKCIIPGVEASPGSWLAVRAASVILDSPVLPVMEGTNVTLCCRKKTPSSNLTADFYKDGLLLQSSSTGNMTIHNVSKCDEGLYKCRISGAGDSAENWLAVRARHRETCPCLDHFSYLLLLLRTVFTILMVALLLLLLGLLHFEKLTVKNK